MIEYVLIALMVGTWPLEEKSLQVGRFRGHDVRSHFVSVHYTVVEGATKQRFTFFLVTFLWLLGIWVLVKLKMQIWWQWSCVLLRVRQIAHTRISSYSGNLIWKGHQHLTALFLDLFLINLLDRRFAQPVFNVLIEIKLKFFILK